jgi:hypothetical protein
MKKLSLPITTEMVSQFENYQDDKSAVHNALNRFVTELPTTMSDNNMSLEQMKTLDSELLFILTEGANLIQEPGQTLEGTSNQIQQTPQNQDMAQTQNPAQTQNSAQDATLVQENVPSQNAAAQQETFIDATQPQAGAQAPEGNQVQEEAQIPEGASTQEGLSVQNDEGDQAGTQMNAVDGHGAQAELSASRKATILIRSVLGEIGITQEDSPAGILQKMATYIAKGDNVSKEALQTLFSNKDIQTLMKEVLEQQLLMEPKDVKDVAKLKKMYDTMDAKIQSINTVLQNTGLQETSLAQTVHEIHANVEFMNQINEAYTFVQIPLKMTNQNASGQLYVYTSKRNLEDPERELTAFLHLDLEHLGATDVSVKMHKKEVATKFYMESDASYDLVKAYMPQLEERLCAKGYNCKIEIENEGRHVNFVEDFLKKDAPSAGMLHRYSFDVRT